ncbi:hypothetical protein EJF18_20376 [Clavispora lusitaniae]|uniref:ATP synthase subunit K n=2 Tax=Clavispora lusitaniae TaxID=36911 RepID=A0AA91PXH0_CLALS|nr:hypothetical protein E0198_001721 [Clavispora lusitaniae]OVF07334.1 hypothetical protein A9F13_13g00297 [Clavispora lusitaniae]QFZ26471.1 hypothetical protein EJF14_20376 [Clavispora lusitaniae]QFZ32139.1 hypothetical protein EJF16_20376 [Clavispora lusitaniae]QFZ37808.1 hypothetical protein EJF15_20376 [Clavispora lusitaniae]
MGAAYTIFGKQVQPHILSILTLGSVALIAAWPREKTEKPAAPAPAVASKDEEFDLEKIISDFTKDEAK